MSEAVPWWRRAVVYQVYLRSFADGNGDGTGDIAGLRARLDHLVDLGVDALWINPWYASPLHDGGYDVADYRTIDPRFGTLDEAEKLLAEAAERGLRVIVDLVPNHTSSEHEWFRAALASPPGSPERARYLFRDGRDGGESPPNNWRATFGGPAWSRVPDGQWYLHLFDVTQPDLDWTNEEVRVEFDDIFRFWLDRGVDGFRIDVAHGLVKEPGLPDVADVSSRLLDAAATDHPYWDRDGVHEIVRRWRAVLDASGRDAMMVAEAWVHPERLPRYLRPDEYHQSFNFDLLSAPWDAEEFHAVIAASLDGVAVVGASSTWVLANHDVMRHATRYGLPPDVDWRRWPLDGPHELLDPETGARRARASALVELALPGAAYVYQGDELGLPEVWDLPTDVLDDPVWERSGHTRKGRDGCRVPIPWTRSGPSFGFGDAEPWLPQPPDFGRRSVEAQRGDDGSMLELYRRAIALRRAWLVDDEACALHPLDGDVLSFERGSGVVCVVNMGSGPAPLRAGDVLLTSEPLPGDGTLPPDVAAWIRP